MSHENIILVNLAIIFILKAICILIGYKTIVLGYKLINDGIKGEFKFSVEYTGIKGGLISASPGLLFVVLGITLIVAGLCIKRNIDYESSQKFSPPPTIMPNNTDSLK